MTRAEIDRVLARFRELRDRGLNFSKAAASVGRNRTHVYRLLSPRERQELLVLGSREQQRAKLATVEQLIERGKISFAQISRLVQVARSTVSRIAQQRIERPSEEDTEPISFLTKRTRAHNCPTCNRRINTRDCLACHLNMEPP